MRLYRYSMAHLLSSASAQWPHSAGLQAKDVNLAAKKPAKTQLPTPAQRHSEAPPPKGQQPRSPQSPARPANGGMRSQSCNGSWCLAAGPLTEIAFSRPSHQEARQRAPQAVPSLAAAGAQCRRARQRHHAQQGRALLDATHALTGLSAVCAWQRSHVRCMCEQR